MIKLITNSDTRQVEVTYVNTTCIRFFYVAKGNMGKKINVEKQRPGAERQNMESETYVQ